MIGPALEKNNKLELRSGWRVMNNLLTTNIWMTFFPLLKALQDILVYVSLSSLPNKSIKFLLSCYCILLFPLLFRLASGKGLARFPLCFARDAVLLRRYIFNEIYENVWMFGSLFMKPLCAITASFMANSNRKLNHMTRSITNVYRWSNWDIVL